MVSLCVIIGQQTEIGRKEKWIWRERQHMSRMASFQSLKHENYEESTVKIAYHWKGLGEMKFRKRDKIILKG